MAEPLPQVLYAYLFIPSFTTKTFIMRRSIPHSVCSRPLLPLLLLFVLYSCRKSDRLADPSSSATESLSKAKRSHPKPSPESAEVVYQWYKYITSLQLPAAPQPVVLAQYRAFAYIGVGLFESVQPGIKGGSSFSPKLYEMPAMPKPDRSKDYLWSASANAALASMFKLFLVNLTDVDKGSIDAKEAALYNQLKALASEDVLQRSAAFGRSIATAIYNWSTTDHFKLTSEGYMPSNEPWAWVPTPPALAPPVGANLQYSRPFLKYTLKATAPPIPVPFSKETNSDFYKAAWEVYQLGGSQSATDANKATAVWWADAGGPGFGLPAPYHLLSIVTTVLESQQSGLWKAAEVYAKTGIGIKDGPIINFRAKFQYNLLRPITYIQRYIDPEWTSVLNAPPYPEYTSGLISNYGPVIHVLINEFGDIAVTDDAYVWRGLPARHFGSLSQLLQEAAYSRIYAGIHYRFTQDVTIAMGAALAREIDKVRVVGPEYQ